MTVIRNIEHISSYDGDTYKFEFISDKYFGVSEFISHRDMQEQGKFILDRLLRDMRGFKPIAYVPKKVIFNNTATIVFWGDGTKTVVKAQGKEKFDKEKGLAMAMVKKFLGNKGNYNNVFKRWCR